MPTAGERKKKRRPWPGTVAVLPWVLSGLAGAVWMNLMYQQLDVLWAISRWGNGTRTIGSMVFQPVLFVLDVLQDIFPSFPPIGWGRAIIIGYYAVLTAILWNAPAGRRRFWLAAVVYGLHASLSLAATLFRGQPFLNVPGIAQYYLWSDLRALLELGQRESFTLATFAVLLLAWHIFAWWRLWCGVRKVKCEA